MEKIKIEKSELNTESEMQALNSGNTNKENGGSSGTEGGKKKMSWAEGLWIAIHLTGADGTTVEKANFYCSWLRMIVANLPCGDCRNHAADYLIACPPEEAEDTFIHGWRFHNAVNVRLKKPEMDYSTAAQIYLGGGVKSLCTTCGSSV